MIDLVIDFAQAHRGKLLLASLAIALLAAWRSMVPEPVAPPATVASAASSSSAIAGTKVLLATANLVATCEGCESAEVTFGPGGAPASIRTRGGRLTIQARVETNERITTSAWTASATSYAASAPAAVEAGRTRFPLAFRGGIRPSGLWAAGLRWDFEASVPFFPRYGMVLGPAVVGGPGLILFTLDIQPTRRR